MRVAILDEDEKRSQMLMAYIGQKYNGWKLLRYKSTFSFVTAIYDEYAGDVDLIIVYTKSADDENCNMAADLQSFFPHIKLIFYSEHTDMCEKIFEARPLYFLLFPFIKANLDRALQRAYADSLEDLNQTLLIHNRGKMNRLKFSAIRYLESDGRKIHIISEEGSFTTYMTISEAMLKLPNNFVQCHRSYLVNSNRIAIIEQSELVLSTGDKIPLSRMHQKLIRELMEIKK